MIHRSSSGAFEFIADRPVLDFVATVTERGSTRGERLRTTDDVARWVQQSGLLPGRPRVSRAQLEQTKQLREAAFGLITALIEHTTPSRADRDVVNRAATRPRPLSQLTATGRVRRTGDLDAALAVLAGDCIDLFDGPDAELVSWCADPDCTRPFIDRSRGHRRRWCDMKGCGDRAKAVAYRARVRTAARGGRPA